MPQNAEEGLRFWPTAGKGNFAIWRVHGGVSSSRRESGRPAGWRCRYGFPRFLSAPGRPGANDRIGVAYIGCGRRARQLMGLPKEGRFVAVADVNLPRAEEVARARGCRAYQDYRKVLDCKDVDGVFVATPDHWHVLASIHACQALKDVYCEKPLSLTIREGRRLVEAVRKHQRVLQTGSMRRSMSGHRLGCELVRNGVAGEIHTVLIQNYPSPWQCRLPGQAVPAGLDWDAWCGQTEPAGYHPDIYNCRAKPGWISFRPYSGGEMTGTGATASIRSNGPWTWTTPGRWKSGAKAGSCRRWFIRAAEGLARGNAATSVGHRVRFRYANGIEIHLEPGESAAGAAFVGDQGKIRIGNNVVESNPPELAKEPPRDMKIRVPVSDNHIQNWFDCIKFARRPSPTWRSATARRSSATWATSSVGWAASFAGTRSGKSSPATTRPTRSSSVPSESRSNCRRQAPVRRADRGCANWNAGRPLPVRPHARCRPAASAGFRGCRCFEPQIAAVALQLDLSDRVDGLAALPVVFQGHVVDDQFAVERHPDLVADHFDVEGVPLADGLVDHLQRIVRIDFIVIQSAGADFVVPDLHLRAAAEIDAAVAVGRDLPVDPHLEITVILWRYRCGCRGRRTPTRPSPPSNGPASAPSAFSLSRGQIFRFHGRPGLGVAHQAFPSGKILAVEEGGETRRRAIVFPADIGHGQDQDTAPTSADQSSHEALL